MANKNTRREIRQQFIEQHLIAYGQSEKSAAAYCREHNLVRQTFYTWLKKQKIANCSKTNAKGRFVAVKIKDKPESGLEDGLFAEIVFAQGKTIRFFQPVDPSLIIQLLQSV